MKTWLKYGLIGALLLLIIGIFGFIDANNCSKSCDGFSCLGCTKFVAISYPMVLLLNLFIELDFNSFLEARNLILFAQIIDSIIVGFLIGAIIGHFIGKRKTSTPQ